MRYTNRHRGRLALERGLMIASVVLVASSGLVSANCYKNNPNTKCCDYCPGVTPGCDTTCSNCCDVRQVDPTVQQALPTTASGKSSKQTGAQHTCQYDKYTCNQLGNCTFLRAETCDCTETHVDPSSSDCGSGGGGGDV